MEIRTLKYFLAVAREENMSRAAEILHVTQPNLHYHITSGDTEQIAEKLDKGLLDFLVLVEQPDTRKYEYIEFPQTDTWGLVIPYFCRLDS